MRRSKTAGTAAALLCLLAACATPPQPKPPAGFRSPDLLTKVLSLGVEPRRVQAQNFLSLVAHERGDRSKPAPKEIAALVPRVVKALRSEPYDEPFTISLITSLGIIRGETAASFLIERSRTSVIDEELSAIAWSLAEFQAPACHHALRSLCRHERMRARMEAALALASTRKSSAMPTLLDGLKDPAAPVRWSAAVGLALHLKNAAGKEILHKMLDRWHVEKQIPTSIKQKKELTEWALRSAADAVWAIRDKSAIEPLRLASLQDPSENIRRHCRQILYRLRFLK